MADSSSTTENGGEILGLIWIIRPRRSMKNLYFVSVLLLEFSALHTRGLQEPRQHLDFAVSHKFKNSSFCIVRKLLLIIVFYSFMHFHKFTAYFSHIQPEDLPTFA